MMAPNTVAKITLAVILYAISLGDHLVKAGNRGKFFLYKFIYFIILSINAHIILNYTEGLFSIGYSETCVI